MSTWRHVCDGARAAAADPEAGTLRWHIELPARGSATININVVAADSSGSEDADAGFDPSAEAVPVYRVAGWRQRAPSVVSTDPRLGPAIDRALADLASLRIVDPEHPDRALIAAGAPWFMTLFGRDSLLTALMTLSFDPDLARGVLATLADLQGTSYDAGVRRAAGQDRPRAAPSGERRHVQHTAALLRNGRRHPAVRHPRRRGVAVGGDSAATSSWRSTRRCNGRSPG